MIILKTKHQNKDHHSSVFQRLEDPVEHRAWGLWTNGKLTSYVYVSAGKHMQQWWLSCCPIHSSVCFLRSLQRKTWPCLRSSSLCLMWHRKHRYNTAPQSVSANSETPLVHVVIELLFSYRTCLGRWQTCWRRSKSKWKKSPYWIINCGFIKWGIDKCLFVCMYMSACSCGCSQRAPGNSTSACGWLSSAPASCRTSLWASWSVRGVHNTHRQSSFILTMYCSAWKNAYT